MLPPPHPPKRVYFSYFERRHQENEAFDDEEENVDVVDEAKRLKHEADQETNMNNRCRKYLQVIVYEYELNTCDVVETVDLGSDQTRNTQSHCIPLLA